MHCTTQGRGTTTEVTSILADPGDISITLETLKAHLKVDGDDEDELIQSYLDSAIAEAESYTRRPLSESVFEAYLDSFPTKAKLDQCPVDITSIEVTYQDENNVTQTLDPAEYFVRKVTDDEYPTIEFNGTMPKLYDAEEVVKIAFDAGYETLPPVIYNWILNRAASLYENRQAQIVSSSANYVYDYSPLFPYKML